MNLRIGARRSRLARAQSRSVGRALQELGHDVEYRWITTTGDRDARGFDAIGSQGVFVRAIEADLVRGEVDVAVHSYKDLPSEGPDTLVVAAIPKRADPRDCLVARAPACDGEGPLPLAEGAVVGTASARRRALVGALRPDLSIQIIRGNVTTRVRRVRDGELDATVLACAGLDRLLEAERDVKVSREEESDEPLDLDGLCRLPLDPERFVPAPAQGALAVQVRRDDDELQRLVSALDDPISRCQAEAERALLVLAGAGCNVALGAWCRPVGGERAGAPAEADPPVAGKLKLVAVMGVEGKLVRATARGSVPDELAREAWDELKRRMS